MKFSVLLNNYNYGRFLGEAIDSVLGQTYTDFELIIVDDGSTDDSRAVIASRSDTRIVPILKENGGQASAFRAGIARASGEYVAFLDADDFWDADKLQHCAEALARESGVALLNHGYRVLGDSAGPPESVPLPAGAYDFRAALRRHKTELPMVPTSFFVGRLEHCRELALDEAWRVAADTPVIVGLALRGKVYNLARVLGTYRCHGANLWLGRSQAELSTHLREGGPAVADEDPNFLYFERFYRMANEEQARLGLTERFNFSKSDYALSHRILRTSRYSPRGVYWRLVKRLKRAFTRPWAG
jgi:glycosyltransferase involved in cell wall biosynthesis